MSINGWSAEDVAWRWLLAYPPKSADGQASDATQAWIDDLASDAQRVDVLRARLVDLGWFMKALKEPLARMANREAGHQISLQIPGWGAAYMPSGPAWIGAGVFSVMWSMSAMYSKFEFRASSHVT